MKKTLLTALIIVLFSCKKDKLSSTISKDEDNKVKSTSSMPNNTWGDGLEMTGFYQGKKIAYYKYGDNLIFQDDIIIPGTSVTNEEHGSGIAFEGNYIWPRNLNLSAQNGTNQYYYEVPYYIKSDVNYNTKINIQNAISHWETNTNLRFVLKNDILYNTPMVYFVNDPNGNCASLVGKQSGPWPFPYTYVELSPSCSYPTIIHEIGHAVGLWHEMSRTDRNNYVQINTENILSGKEANFKTYAQEGKPGFNAGPFDFQSVMMYGAYNFSKNNSPTIQRLDGSTNWGPLPNGALSPGDITTISKIMYPKGGYTTANGKLIIPVSGKLRRTDYINGGFVNLNDQWNDVKAMASYNGYIYIVANDYLHKVDPSTGNYTLLGGQIWDNIEVMCASSNGYLYIVGNGYIHKVNPSNGNYTLLGNYGNPEWWGTQALDSYNGYLYVAQGDYMHKVNETTGAWSFLGSGVWSGTQSVTSGNDGYIYIFQNSRIHKMPASTTNGSHTIIGEPEWSGMTKTTLYNGFLYVINNRRIHKVDKTTGAYELIGGYPEWGSSEGIAAY